MRLNRTNRCHIPPVSIWNRFWKSNAVKSKYNRTDVCPDCGREIKEHSGYK